MSDMDLLAKLRAEDGREPTTMPAARKMCPRCPPANLTVMAVPVVVPVPAVVMLPIRMMMEELSPLPGSGQAPFPQSHTDICCWRLRHFTRLLHVC